MIRIIREEEHPKTALIEAFDLSERQADAILDLKLRHLAKLEEFKIKGEQDELQTERQKLKAILGSDRKLNTLVVKELESDAKTHGDERKTRLIERTSAQALDSSQLIAADPITVILSEKGWIRAGKGHELDPEQLNYRAGDGYLTHCLCKTNQQLVVFDDQGRSYTLATHGLPSARSLGEPLSSKLAPPSGASFIGLIQPALDQYFLMTSSIGYGFYTLGESFISKNKAGKAIINTGDGNPLLPQKLEEETHILLANSNGRLLLIQREELSELNKGKGLKLMQLNAKHNDEMIAAIPVKAKTKIEVISGRRKLNLSWKDLQHYEGSRGNMGNKLPKGYPSIQSIRIVSS